MLSEKPWKAEAIARLLLSVLVCLAAASLVVSGFHYAAGGKTRLAFFALAAVALGFLIAAVLLMQKLWTLENFVSRAVGLMVCIFAGLSAGAWAEKIAGPTPANNSGQQMLLTEAVVIILLARFVREHGVSWAEAFGLRNRWGYAALAGVTGACVFMPVGEGLQWASVEAMTRLHWKPHEQQAVQVLRETAGGTARLSLALLAIFLAPMVEEILFRGILYPAIKKAGFPRLALCGTAFLFAIMHSSAAIFAPLVVLAIMFTLLYEKTNNLLAPIAAHAVFNGLNFAKLYLFEKQMN